MHACCVQRKNGSISVLLHSAYSRGGPRYEYFVSISVGVIDYDGDMCTGESGVSARFASSLHSRLVLFVHFAALAPAPALSLVRDDSLPLVLLTLGFSLSRSLSISHHHHDSNETTLNFWSSY